ncbi:hypothetical protein NI454_09260 [Brevundimonas diminuta]|uniref:hypothetical protein n=1 Tax=Brevundimonas diminuta TaxID=293 RepID=UPI00209769AF|nr:hypothetical protein [Brevundimonas diminuta]MCO8030139.1 hypothetical protein [Brevundimonas diminuta]
MSHYRDLADGWATNRGGGPAATGYDAWVAHVRATATERGWVGDIGGPYDIGRYWTTANNPAGEMFGSPWGYYQEIAWGASFARIVQHALPTEAVFNTQVAAKRVILLRKFSASDTHNSRWNWQQSRNGYTTQLFPDVDPDGATPASLIDMCAWWEGDPLTGQAMMNNPYAMTGPVPYSAPGW